MLNQNDLDKICESFKSKCPVGNDDHTLVMVTFSNSKKRYFGCAKSNYKGRHYGCYYITGTGRLRRYAKDMFEPLKLIMIENLLKGRLSK